MSRLHFLYLLALSATALRADAPLPSNIGILYWLNGDELVRLEKTTYSARTDNSDIAKDAFLSVFTLGLSKLVNKTEMGIIGIVEGASSPVKVAGSRPQFLIRAEPGQRLTELQLVPLASVRKHRELPPITVGASLTQMSVEGIRGVIDLDRSFHHGDNTVVVLTPAQALRPGEYAICSPTTMAGSASCFSLEAGGEVAPRGPASERRDAGALDEDPAAVLEAFIAAHERGDLDGAAALVTRASRLDFKKRSRKAGKEAFQGRGSSLRGANYQLDREASSGEEASFRSGDDSPSLTLSREDGAWKVNARGMK